ncbi:MULTISPECIES: DUF3135 domain-containing protein [unclassified Limnobacter]|jgi:hypothetical protein|uniref:DUF3135 domain-containing protein n=1 Tax=unclassified Limnobacter TaxID=2630203 RepID=UPI000156C305|nr:MULTISPECIES: DUF3135 domain-containing protein [unclassified Limnobacter]EDM84125.1 hypothetical protein LMED105_14153 [Limnobacter sp. MED105]MBA4314598.1 DUF3135 domain-containing protein [Alcaligenaceae bacterium]
MTHFDFKEWADLYQVDPAAFEQRREAVLEGYVASVDPEHRLALEQTLFKIRMIRQRSKSPLQSAMESSKLMWESFGKLREQVQKLEQELSPAPLKQNGLRLIDSNFTTDVETSVEQSEPAANLARIIPFTASGKRAH